MQYKLQLTVGLNEEYPAGSSFFILYNIRLFTQDPIWTLQFPLGFKEREVLVTEVNKQLKARVIEETNDTKYNEPRVL